MELITSTDFTDYQVKTMEFALVFEVHVQVNDGRVKFSVAPQTITLEENIPNGFDKAQLNLTLSNPSGNELILVSNLSGARIGSRNAQYHVDWDIDPLASNSGAMEDPCYHQFTLRRGDPVVLARKPFKLNVSSRIETFNVCIHLQLLL
jgi:hypothetical protein